MDRATLAVNAPDFWAAAIGAVTRVDWPDYVRQLLASAETRRARADYDTGSITEDEAFLLFGMAEHLKARVVIEVGTFIGTSTTALASASTVTDVYTCDASNDCLPADRIIHPYPKRTSTQMLLDLYARQVQADLCFFDGTLHPADVRLLVKLTGPQTVFAVHDYNYGPKIRHDARGEVYHEIVPRKGIGNIDLLAPRFPNHHLVEPLIGTTLAALIPVVLM